MITSNTGICIDDLDRMVSIEESEYAASKLQKSNLSILECFKLTIEQIDRKYLCDLICKTFKHH
ncbi:MAG: hypothetical protein HRT68_03405 [Flavobacteriaceae bacterium]|nr:hypothetical protein [Flavobacteriaceae bacterium]